MRSVGPVAEFPYCSCSLRGGLLNDLPCPATTHSYHETAPRYCHAMAADSAPVGRVSCILKRCAVGCRPRPAFEYRGRVFWRASRRWVDPAKHASLQSRLASRLVFFPSTRPATVASNPCLLHRDPIMRGLIHGPVVNFVGHSINANVTTLACACAHRDRIAVPS